MVKKWIVCTVLKVILTSEHDLKYFSGRLTIVFGGLLTSHRIFSTSDSSSDVLLLSKVRDLENFGSGLGADLSKPIRGSERSHDLGRGLGADREWIPSYSCDLSEPIRGSESQSGSLPIPS